MPLEKADRRTVAWLAPADAHHHEGRGRHNGYLRLMFLPSRFDSTRKYPIINNAYPDRNREHGQPAFTAARGDARLAESASSW